MLSSLTQLLASEPLALVCTAVAEPDERELAVAQRRHVPSQKNAGKSISALPSLKATAKSSSGEGDTQERYKRELEAVPARHTEALMADITHPQVPFRVFLTQDATFHGLLVLRLATRRHRYNLSDENALKINTFSSSVKALSFL